MKGIDHKTFALGRLYGRALLDAAGLDDAEALGGELAEVAALLDRAPDLETFLASPTVDAEAKTAAIEKTFRGRASDLLTDALQVIGRKGRLSALRAIVAGFEAEHREARGILAATVETARPLEPAQLAALEAAIAQYTGKRIELTEQVDPKLLGGVVVRAGDERIDGSALAALAAVSARLGVRAAREIVSGPSYVEA
ncbi:MAG TPA: ATP synthase F1 subunit delta [Thermoanaerobaculia bacterium]|nr:ATP synthase F1 subunit delta [Thermoanaerobaculia bacterium]